MKDCGFSLSDWIEQSRTSKNFEGFKVYVIRIYNDSEEFIKIGRTFNSIEKRFSLDGSLPYSYEILYIVEDNNAHHIFNLETKLKRQFKKFKYLPKLKFKGSSECFEYEIISQIKEIINGNT